MYSMPIFAVASIRISATHIYFIIDQTEKEKNMQSAVRKFNSWVE